MTIFSVALSARGLVSGTGRGFSRPFHVRSALCVLATAQQLPAGGLCPPSSVTRWDCPAKAWALRAPEQALGRGPPPSPIAGGAELGAGRRRADVSGRATRRC